MSDKPICLDEIPDGALIDISHFPDLGGNTGKVTCTAAAWKAICGNLMEDPLFNGMSFKLCLTAMRTYHRDSKVPAICISVHADDCPFWLKYCRDSDGIGFTIMLREEK